MRLHDGVHVHAANLLHLGARNRLAIGDDGQRLQRRLRQSRRTDFLAHQRLEPRRVFGLRNELPRAGDARKPVAARGGFVFARQLFQRRGQFAVLDFGERLGGGVGILGFGGRSEYVAQFLYAQRLLRGEQERFQNEFQFHTIYKKTKPPSPRPSPGFAGRGRIAVSHNRFGRGITVYRCGDRRSSS